MAGRPYLVRLAGFGLRAPKARVRGSEVAGVVAAVGPDVTRFVVGDEVFGVAKGSFADFACARADKLTAKPADLGFVPAAAVAVSALTALQAVRDRGKVTAGQRVLVVGASGGVGSFAVQIATSSGAEVTGVCRGAKADLVRSLGAAHVVDYEHEDFAAVGNRYDVVIDTGGNSSLRRLRRCLTPRGTLVIVGGEGGGRWFGGIDRQLRATMLSLVVRQKLGTFIASENATDLDVLCRMVESGAIRPAVERTYPLAETPAAVEHVVAGRARGKVVVVVAG
jgi:NADPH:quinone reductase-like Zn-dependent oxidoreductase